MIFQKNPFVFFVLVLASILLCSCGSCDGVALNFYKVFEQQTQNDLLYSFSSLIDENTERLSECIVTSYSKSDISESSEWLQEYNLERYDVSYSCDILAFIIDIYKMGNGYYIFRPERVACGLREVSVQFHESAENLVDLWYSSNYLLEYIVISQNIDDLPFCTKLEMIIFGDVGDHCR